MLRSSFPKRWLPFGPLIGRPLSSDEIVIALLLPIVILAAALRFYGLDAKGLWVDEIFTASFASANNDLAAVVQGALSTPLPSPPLWFLITHFFVKVLGNSDVVVRLPSVFAGILGIGAVYKVGETLFDRTTGLISAFLLTVSPAHLYFSQEARFYAGVVLVSLLTLYLLYRGINSSEKKWWIGFTVATLVNLYIHLTAFLVFAVEILYACLLLTHSLATVNGTGGIRRLRATFALPLLISLGVIIVGYAPMMPHLLAGMQGPRGLGNPGAVEGLPFSAQDFLSLFGGFSSGTGIPLSLYMGASLWGLANAARQHRRQVLLVLLWIIVPFVIILLFRPKHWFEVKYVIFILPVYLIATSLGIASAARAIAAFISDWGILRRAKCVSVGSWGHVLSLSCLVAIYGLLSASALDEVYAWQSDRWKDIGQFLISNVQPQDAIVLLPLTVLTMPVQDIVAYYGPSPDETNVIVVDNLSQVEDILARHRRVWIVRGLGVALDPSGEVIEWLKLQPHVALSIRGGTKLMYTGKDQTQLALLEEAGNFASPTAELHGSIAEAYRSLRMWPEAQAAYARAAALEPAEGIWHYHLAALDEEMGERDKALVEYQQAIRLQPEIAGFHAALGDLYRQSGLADEAISQYREAIRLYTSQNSGAKNSKDVRLWNDLVRKLEMSAEQTGAADNTP
ncbi:MAG: glycosyltransferase family 39 protein [Chloroflexi bacterium]|nr:glycosyltransferase family 39 protein [Chloroflexota bacterium]